MVQLQLLNKILRTSSLDIVYENDLTPEHFSQYPSEFAFIMDHYKKYGNVPDMETFIEQFEEFDIIEVAESDEYLIDKITEEYQYAQTVPVIKKAADILKTDSRDAVDYLKAALKDIDSPSGISLGVDIIADARIRYNEYVKKRDSKEPWMIPTGFKELDDAIGGWCPTEEFVIFFARTNQGKSWMLCKTLEHAWKRGLNVGYISPEMSESQIGYRFDTLNANFSNFSLYAGRDVENYEEYIEELTKRAKNKFVVATPSKHFNKKVTVSKLKKFCERNKLDILGIDGIVYMVDERYHRGDNKTTSLTNISEDLIGLSTEIKIPVLAVIQANRSGVEEDGSPPALESIRDSDGPAQNATKVISFRQKDSKLTLEVVKSRFCKVGTKLSYIWNIDVGTFEYTPTDNEPVTVRDYTATNNEVENRQPLTARRRGATEGIVF